MIRELKNLKVSPAVHHKIKVAAAEDDISIREYCDAAIEIALEYRNKIRKLAREKMVDTQNGKG
jgi:hypothetical protein